MTKEQQIYINMKKHHRLKKSHGKYLIYYSSLACAIDECGYEDKLTQLQIVHNMQAKGYIRPMRDVNGRPNNFIYIIEKWVN